MLISMDFRESMYGYSMDSLTRDFEPDPMISAQVGIFLNNMFVLRDSVYSSLKAGASCS